MEPEPEMDQGGHVRVFDPTDQPEEPEEPAVPWPALGEVVQVRTRDWATGRETIRPAVVVERGPAGRPAAVRVSWLPHPTDLICLDPAVHGNRPDAPRVEPLGG